MENRVAETAAGRDGRTYLARPNYQARKGSGERISLVQLTARRIDNHTGWSIFSFKCLPYTHVIGDLPDQRRP